MPQRISSAAIYDPTRLSRPAGSPARNLVMVPDWVDQNQKPDLYTRGLTVGAGPQLTPPGGMTSPALSELIATAEAEAWATTPGQRPFVYQNFMQFAITVGTTPVPLIPLRTEVDTIVFNVISTAANSVFWGGQAVTITTGMEIQPGVPISMGPDNTREQWELQRVLEYIGAIVARSTGREPLSSYRAPRVVFDASKVFLVAAANTQVNLALFIPPELQ